MHVRLTLCVTFLFALTACGETSTPSTDKGAEEEELVGGKQDSFFKPTEHGQLVYGLPNEASIDDDARFHSWEFALTGPATVGIQTNVSKNLDTVMYLYRRDTPDEAWGRFVQKNDDWKGNIWSRIELDADDAGLYRVVVKPFKKALRGTFTVTAECAGDGCQTHGDECDGEFAVPPDQTSYGHACAAKVVEILGEPATAGGGLSIGFHAERCDLPSIERQAADFYRGYWDDIFGFDDLGDGDDVFLNLGTTEHGDKGTTVSIDAGGDEDTLIFVFDGDDQLVMYYHDEQSPTSAWFCADGAEDDDAEPSEDCVAATLYGVPHSDSEKIQGSTTPGDAKADLGSPAWAGIAQLAADLGLGDDATVTYEGRSWESEHSEAGAMITASRDGASITYLVSDRFGEIAVPLRIDADGTTKFICGEFDDR